MSDVAIKVEGLSKKYILHHQQAGTLRDTLAMAWKQRLKAFSGRETFWALDNVSFEVPHGQVLGIIGRNGAGKSTLLKILSRITPPTKGRVELNGRVASLLEVGTGFHPELTGRENIFLNGSILGMSRAEIHRKFDEIVAFSGVERFLDTPVKHYSSGMYVRLAFSVAAHLEAEILLLDEVLAVGDAEFQKKSLQKINNIQDSGKTVLLVSHSTENLNRFCKKGLLLNSGQLCFYGSIKECIEKYTHLIFHNQEFQDLTIERYRKLPKNEIWFHAITVDKADRNFDHSEHLKFILEIYSRKNFQSLRIGATIFNEGGLPVGSSISEEVDFAEGTIKKMEFQLIDCKIAPGNYHMGFSIGPGTFNNRLDYDLILGFPEFQVSSSGEKDAVKYWKQAWGNLIFKCHLSNL